MTTMKLNPVAAGDNLIEELQPSYEERIAIECVREDIRACIDRWTTLCEKSGFAPPYSVRVPAFALAAETASLSAILNDLDTLCPEKKT
jgi:hypothetical protein